MQEQLREFIGRKVNVVLRDGSAMIGSLQAAGTDQITIVNMAQRKQHFPLSSVAEVYIDSVV